MAGTKKDPRAAWQALMTASMDFTDVKNALHADRPKKAAQLLAPIIAVVKRHDDGGLLRELQKILKLSKRGHFRRALLEVGVTDAAFNRAIVASRRPSRPRGRFATEGATMGTQVSPEFKRAVEAEVGRLMEANRPPRGSIRLTWRKKPERLRDVFLAKVDDKTQASIVSPKGHDDWDIFLGLISGGAMTGAISLLKSFPGNARQAQRKAQQLVNQRLTGQRSTT